MYTTKEDILLALITAISDIKPLINGEKKVQDMVKGYSEAIELVKQSQVIKQDLANAEALYIDAAAKLEEAKSKAKFAETKESEVALLKKSLDSVALAQESKQAELDKLQFALDTAIAEAKDEKKKAIAAQEESEKSKEAAEELKGQLSKKINALNQIG
jgi:hypothetical protein